MYACRAHACDVCKAHLCVCVSNFQCVCLHPTQSSSRGGAAGSPSSALEGLLATTNTSSASGGGGSLISSGAGAGLLRPYSLPDLQADINRWPPAYYSKQGKEPLLYFTVLLFSLQLPHALRFLWQVCVRVCWGGGGSRTL
jgi:hypothetical protein